MAGEPQRILERYDLVERLAVGGMAEVFLAKAYGAHGFAKTLAVKRILPELAANAEFEERFIAEAKLAVTLNHTNVVQVFDFGRFGDSLFIAMEYVDGVDLAALLSRYRKRNERVPIPAAFQIAIDIARGLDYAHKQGVIHRDVSPSNILLSQAGEVKIADFGIALTGTEDFTNSSHRRRIMGKWRYMSPEQTRGHVLETRSDLFAAAAVIYELFIGAKLFPGEEVDDIVHNIHYMDIPKPSENRTGLPPQLDAILIQALSRDPHQRPERAAEIQRALTEISYESSIVATPMDVADAVSRIATPRNSSRADTAPPRKRALDDLIREQLLSQPERRTAVTASESSEDALGEARVATEPHDEEVVESSAADDDKHTDTDRRPTTIIRTGIGPDGVNLFTLHDAPAKPPAKRARYRYLSLAIAAAAILTGGWMVWRTAAGPPDAVAKRLAVPDAGAAELPPAELPEPGFLQLDSNPPGAQIWLDGVKLESVTPFTSLVDTNQAHRIEVVMDGYQSAQRGDVRIAAGHTESIHFELVPKPASLEVRTDPPGAQVAIDERTYGPTPVTIQNLPPRPAQSLTLSKKGYRAISRSVDLLPGGRSLVDEKLSRQTTQRPRTPFRYGYVDIHVENSWAEIYKGKRKLGEAPVKNLKLPVGSHRLRLYNPVTKKQAFVVVEVVADASKYYPVAL